MAAKFRKIDPRIWDDEKFRELSPDDQRVTLYLLTNPQTNRIGIYKFSPAQAAESLKMDLDTFGERFRDVLNAFGWSFDPRARVLYFDTWWKYNHPENSNVMIGNLGDLHDLPQSELVEAFRKNLTYLSGKVRTTFAERWGEPILLEPSLFSETGARARAEAGARAEVNGGAPKPEASTADDQDPIVLTFETISGKRSQDSQWHLRQSKLTEYAHTYPGINVEQEARKAWQWARDNPSKRKTASGMPDYLRRWMDTAQNRSGGRSAPIPGTAPARGDLRSARNAAALGYRGSRANR